MTEAMMKLRGDMLGRVSWLLAALCCANATAVPTARPTVGRLRGGEGSLVVRVRTRDGMKRLSLAGEGATVADLQRLVQRECKVPISKQRLACAGASTADLDLADADRTLADLGIAHGTMLQLSELGGSPAAESKGSARRPAGATRVEAGRRRRTVKLQDYNDERAKNEVMLKVSARCALTRAA